MAGEFEELIETRKLKLENGEEEIPSVPPHRPIEAQRSALLETPSRQPSSLDMQHAAA
jgi:hypothetical protein